MASRKLYAVASTATISHVALVWAENPEQATRQAEGHLKSMATMRDQSGVDYNPNITSMAAHLSAITSVATRSS